MSLFQSSSPTTIVPKSFLLKQQTWHQLYPFYLFFCIVVLNRQAGDLALHIGGQTADNELECWTKEVGKEMAILVKPLHWLINYFSCCPPFFLSGSRGPEFNGNSDEQLLYNCLYNTGHLFRMLRWRKKANKGVASFCASKILPCGWYLHGVLNVQQPVKGRTSEMGASSNNSHIPVTNMC